MMEQDKIILGALLRIMPFLAQSFEDIVVTLSDREKYIYYKAGKQLDHKIKPGDPVKEGSMMHRTYKHKGFSTANIDAEVFGMPYSALGFPVFDAHGEIIGGMVFCEPIETRENKSRLKTLAEEMAKNTALMCENIDSFKDRSENINSTVKNLLAQAEESSLQKADTDNISNSLMTVTGFINQTGEMAKELSESSKTIENLVDILVRNDKQNNN